MKYKKLTLAMSMIFAGHLHAQDTVDVPNINVIANPLIEETHLDAYSITSSILTQDQIRDRNAVDIA